MGLDITSEMWQVVLNKATEEATIDAGEHCCNAARDEAPYKPVLDALKTILATDAVKSKAGDAKVMLGAVGDAFGEARGKLSLHDKIRYGLTIMCGEHCCDAARDDAPYDKVRSELTTILATDAVKSKATDPKVIVDAVSDAFGKAKLEI